MVYREKVPAIIAIEKWECLDGTKVFFFLKQDGTAKAFARSGRDSVPMERITKDGVFTPPEGAVFDRLEL